MRLLERLSAIYGEVGAHAYFGESVTTLEHSLQTAHFARQANASHPLVLAALLHDLGHLIAPTPQDLGDWAEDARHEDSGSRWLEAPIFLDSRTINSLPS